MTRAADLALCAYKDLISSLFILRPFATQREVSAIERHNGQCTGGDSIGRTYRGVRSTRDDGAWR